MSTEENSAALTRVPFPSSLVAKTNLIERGLALAATLSLQDSAGHDVAIQELDRTILLTRAIAKLIAGDKAGADADIASAEQCPGPQPFEAFLQKNPEFPVQIDAARVLERKKDVDNRSVQTIDRQELLEEALRDATDDIWLHSSDYHHVTPKEKLSAWKELLQYKKDGDSKQAQTTDRERLLEEALRDATDDIWLHSSDYHHVTPKEKLSAWKELLQGQKY